jgi:hypothetical protein
MNGLKILNIKFHKLAIVLSFIFLSLPGVTG